MLCGKCSGYIDSPVTLPCSHSLCYKCAQREIKLTSNGRSPRKTLAKDDSRLPPNSFPTKMNGLSPSHLTQDRTDCASDDSGYLSMLELHSCLHQQIQGPIQSLKCPRCSVSFILDDRGVDCLPRNFILESIIQKHKSRSAEVYCQLCEGNTPQRASVMCEQCQILYCNDCLLVCHPKRGPLASHSLVPPNMEHLGHQQIKNRGVLKCCEHEEETISMYCALCKMPVCYLCFDEGRHHGHDAKALGIMFKEQKVLGIISYLYFYLSMPMYHLSP